MKNKSREPQATWRDPGRMKENLRKRRTVEARFKWIGRAAIDLAMSFLAVLFISIFSKGIPGFFQYYVTLEVYLAAERIDPDSDTGVNSLFSGDAKGRINDAIFEVLQPERRKAKKAARKLVSAGAEKRLRNMIFNDPNLLGQTIEVQFALDDDIDSFLRGFIDRNTPEADRQISDTMIGFVDTLNETGLISYRLSDYLFFGSASRNAEMAGIKGAFIGSMITLAICLSIAFPLGAATAVYLEEFAPKTCFTEFV